jgi:hypothetical protein
MPSRTIASTSRAHFVISCGAIFNISHPHLSMFFAAVEALSPSVYGARIGRVSADFRQLGQVLAAAKGPRPPDRHSSLGSPACFLSDISGWRGGGLYPLASRASGRIRRLAPAIGDGRRVCDGTASPSGSQPLAVMAGRGGSTNYRRSSRHAEHVRGPAFRLGLVGALDAVPALGLGTI